MLNPRHILITGASSGLGAALALEYAAPGIWLSLHGRDDARLGQIAQQAHKQGALVSIQTGDVTDVPHMENWIKMRDQAVPVDLIIANAGISGGTAGGDPTAAIFAVNVTGVLNTIQPVLPAMIARRKGQLAIVSSLASFRGLPGAAAYCASKAAIRVYGEGLRGEMARHKVAVNVICPGFIKTPMTDVNPFPMPFMMLPAQAARIIRIGLAHNQGRIAFPWPLYALVRLMTALPQPVMDFISRYMAKRK